MKFKICIPITGRTEKEWKEMIHKAEKEADLLELRFDYLKKINKKLLKIPNLPYIAVLRPFWEGGYFKGREEERIRILKELLLSAEWVDVELDSGYANEICEIAKEVGVKPIVSKHYFTRTPKREELINIVKKELKAGADVCKVVGTANRFSDNLRPLELIKLFKKKTKIVSFCMGEKGIPSRILSIPAGAYFTYACLEYGKESAPGQISVKELRELEVFL